MCVRQGLNWANKWEDCHLTVIHESGDEIIFSVDCLRSATCDWREKKKDYRPHTVCKYKWNEVSRLLPSRRPSTYQKNERKRNKRWPPIGESLFLDNWNCTPLYVYFFFFFYFFLFGIDGLDRVTKYNNPFLSPSRDTHSQHTVHTEWMKEKKRKEKKNLKTNMPTTRRAIVSAATYTSLSVGANKYVNKLFFCVFVCVFYLIFVHAAYLYNTQVTHVLFERAHSYHVHRWRGISDDSWFHFALIQHDDGA